MKNIIPARVRFGYKYLIFSTGSSHCNEDIKSHIAIIFSSTLKTEVAGSVLVRDYTTSQIAVIWKLRSYVKFPCKIWGANLQRNMLLAFCSGPALLYAAAVEVETSSKRPGE